MKVVGGDMDKFLWKNLEQVIIMSSQIDVQGQGPAMNR